MICCCSLAETAACENCSNYKSYYGNRKSFTWVDNTAEELNSYNKKNDTDLTTIYLDWLREHPEWFSNKLDSLNESNQIITCKECKYFKIEDDDIYDKYYYLKRVSVAKPDFGCIYGEKE